MRRPSPWRVIAIDALRAAWARPLPTFIGALVIGVVCVVTLLTTGRTAATEAQVVASIDSVGTRLIIATDSTGNAGIDPAAADAVTALEGVDWAIGLGPAVPVINPAVGPVLGESTTGRALIGDLPRDAAITVGRAPLRPGEAIVSEEGRRALSLTDAAGSLDADDQPIAVVGQYDESGQVEAAGATVLYRAQPAQNPPVRYLYALAREGADVPELAHAVEAVIPAHQPGAIDVDVPSGAIELREVVSGTLGAAARQLMAIVLGTGLVLVAVTTAGAVAARRRDFGRQRALGAQRLHVIASVLLHSGLAGVLGAVGGLIVGFAATWALTGTLPGFRFSLGLAGLTLYVTLLGSIPPAAFAAMRDPVRILRVP